MEQTTSEQSLIDNITESTIKADKKNTKILIGELLKKSNEEDLAIDILQKLINSGQPTAQENFEFFLIEYFEETLKIQFAIQLYKHFVGFDIAEDKTELITDKIISSLRNNNKIQPKHLSGDEYRAFSDVQAEAISLFTAIIEVANNINKQKNNSINHSDIQHLDDLYQKQMNFLFLKMEDFRKDYQNKTEKELDLISKNQLEMINFLVKKIDGEKNKFLTNTGQQFDLNIIVDEIFKAKIKTSDNHTLICQFYLDTTHKDFTKLIEKSFYIKRDLQNSLLKLCEYNNGYNILNNSKCINFNHSNTRDDKDKSPTILCDIKSENLEGISEIIKKVMKDSLSDSVLNTKLMDKDYFDREIQKMLRDTSLFQKLNETKAPTISKARGKI